MWTKLFLLLLASFVLTCTSAKAQTSEVFRGISSVGVRVNVAGDAKGKVSEGPLHTYIEMRLRQAGINVVQGEAPIRLIFNVNGLEHQSGRYVLALEWSLWEQVSLSRRPTQKVFVSTFSVKQLVSRGEGNLNDLRAQVEEFMDYFVNEFLRANPR